MTEPDAPWRVAITIRRPSEPSARRIAEALRPEASREVPRSTAQIASPSPGEVAVTIRAQDTGALRASLNAHLGWIRLALEAERVADSAGP
ncbi:MAG TPA: KEOPS complex subunit Pcc1 [Thermoplasmata archaeon]|nr:KEOPS complex subunit Pcc1 [Thermoplasmata archaeon]